MGKLVHGHIQQRNIARSRGIVKAVVPVAGQAGAVVVHLAVKIDHDVVLEGWFEQFRSRPSGVQVKTRQLVGQRRRIPRIRVDRCRRKVGEYADRAGRPQHGRGRTARQRLKGRLDHDIHVALEQAAPQLGGQAQHVQPLLAQRPTRIAADRTERSGIVEAHLDRIDIVDPNRHLGPDRRGQDQQAQPAHAETHEPGDSHYSSARSGSWWPPVSRTAAACSRPDTQLMSGSPCSLTWATEKFKRSVPTTTEIVPSAK